MHQALSCQTIHTTSHPAFSQYQPMDQPCRLSPHHLQPFPAAMSELLPIAREPSVRGKALAELSDNTVVFAPPAVQLFSPDHADTPDFPTTVFFSPELSSPSSSGHPYQRAWSQNRTPPVS